MTRRTLRAMLAIPATVGVYAVGQVALTIAVVGVRPDLTGVGAILLWGALPVLVIDAAMAAAAVLVWGRPRGVWWIAVPAPAAVYASSAVLQVATGSVNVISLVACAAAGAGGVLAGVAAARRFGPRPADDAVPPYGW